MYPGGRPGCVRRTTAGVPRAPGLRSTKREWVGSRAAAPRAQCSERPLDTEHPGQRALRTPLNRTPHTVRDGGGAWAQRQPMGLGADQSTT